ncbi:hypothetical protein LguiA_026085 [Lonicera macranthoides]
MKDNPSKGRNWASLVEEEPFMSWEARADMTFNAAINNIDAYNGCIQVEQDDRSSIRAQDFPPLQKQQLSTSLTHPISSDSKLCSTTNSSSPEYVPSPLKTRAQRQKTGNTVLPLHKQKKMSKAAKREANAVFRLAKSKPSLKNHDPDEFQWQTLLANQKKRQEEEKAIKNNELGATAHIDATATFNQSTYDNEDNNDDNQGSQFISF